MTQLFSLAARVPLVFVLFCSLDHRVRSVEPDIRMITVGSYCFDPLATDADLTERLTVEGDTHYRLVQFDAMPDDPDLAMLDGIGGRRIWHQSGSTFLVRFDATDTVNMLAANPLIRWIGPYQAAFRMDDSIRDVLFAEYPESRRYPVRLIVADEDVEAFLACLKELDAELFGSISEISAFGARQITCQIASSDLDALAAIEGVLRVEPYFEARMHDERSSQILAGNYNLSYQPTGPGYATWLTQRGVNGSGVTVEMVDSGLCTGNNTTLHMDLRLRVAFHNDTTGQGNRDAIGHGTNCAGIVAGNGALGVTDALGYKYGLGVAPGANVGNTRIFNDSGSFSNPDLVTTTRTAYSNGARLSSQSWGSSPWLCSGYPMTYSSQCVTYDTFIRDADTTTAGNQGFCVFNSAGNDGDCYSSTSSPGNCGDPAIAKNLITVGASENYRMDGSDGCGVANSGADSGRDKINFSSVGPTSDGRIKPDLMAPGTHIQSLASQYSGYNGNGVCDQYWPSGQTNYNWCSGTSQACLHAAGAGALVYQYYLANQGAAPSPAMIKAALINGADDMAGGQSGHSSPATLPAIPNRYQGWGRINLSKTIGNGMSMVYKDQQTVFGAVDEYYEIDLDVANES